MLDNENNLFVLAEQEDDVDPYHWFGMPEYVQKNNKPYDEITVRFRNQEDLEEFCKLIGQENMAEPKKRNKSCWYPKWDRMGNTLNRWFDEDDMDDDDKEEIDYA